MASQYLNKRRVSRGWEQGYVFMQVCDSNCLGISPVFVCDLGPWGLCFVSVFAWLGQDFAGGIPLLWSYVPDAQRVQAITQQWEQEKIGGERCTLHTQFEFQPKKKRKKR